MSTTARRSTRSRVRRRSRLKSGVAANGSPSRRVSPGFAAWEEAKRYLVGGVDSPVRAFRHVGGPPLMLVRGHGPEVVDSRRQRYVDFIMGWGALIHGHNPPATVRVLRHMLRRGILMGLTHPAEVELARLIASAVPSVEQVRFTVSGTEACMTAIRLARAVSGRTRLLVFDGGYHGHSDSPMARKTAGIPEPLSRETLSIPFNDLTALEATLERVGRELAAVIVEPVAANTGVVLPEPGFLERLRALTAQCGALLIFDEVVTGFRLGPGGAQERFKIRPDLTTFGKIIGGGMPIGALGGPQRIMQRLAPEGDVYHGGTFAGHPLSMTAGVEALKSLAAHPPYARLEQLTRRLVEGLEQAADDAGVAVRINWIGSMLTVFFAEEPVRNAAQAQASRRERFTAWAQSLRRRGILVPPSPVEAMFVSTAHTDQHITDLIEASAEAFAAMRTGTGEH